jgi:sugar lactone lactonase YvrE
MLTAHPFVGPDLGNGDRVILGEGPVIYQGKLLSTEARKALLRVTDLDTAATENIDLRALLEEQGYIGFGESQILGCVAETQDGRLLAALSSGIYLLDLTTREMKLFSHPESERSGIWYNDGKVGPDGAFYVGGMTGLEGAGRLWRVDARGRSSEPLKGAPLLTTPNGLHWYPTSDPDVWNFYYVCSLYPAVQHYEHWLSEGTMVRQPDLIPLPHDKFGFLDGMAGADNGYLYLCLYLGYCSCIVIDSRSGEIVEEIVSSAPQATSATIWDSHLYLTSAAQEYRPEDFAAHPDAGAIFKCDLSESLIGKVRETRAHPPFKFRIAPG